jgi:glycosyltransferase involved in cell wall biosynthesis
MKRKIKVLMDQSHSNWVLGGIFTEITLNNPKLFEKPMKISNLRSLYIFNSFFRILRLNLENAPLLFSSLTPLENYRKLSLINLNPKFLFFTHSVKPLTAKQIKIINEVDKIFCMSEVEKRRLIDGGITKPIVPVIGGIDPNRFKEIAQKGNKIVWVGTPVERKNPQQLIEFIRLNPDLDFLVIGKGWKSSTLYGKLKLFRNVEYKEFMGPLSSRDFDHCSHYLMMSNVEGGPMPLLETLASGLIPICTRVGFVEEILLKFNLENQLIDFPINLNLVRSKYLNSYSDLAIQKNRIKALEFSIKRLSDIFYYEIQKFFS